MSIRYVELVGAPGSGKTTLADWLSGRRIPGSPARWILPPHALRYRPRMAGPLTTAALMHPAALALAARAPGIAGRLYVESPGVRSDAAGDSIEVQRVIGHTGVVGLRAEPGYRAEALRWLGVTLEQVAVAQAAPPRLIPLLHEGIIQRTLSVLGSSPDPAALDLLLGIVPSDALVVHLQVAEQLLASRTRVRLEAGLAPRLHHGLLEREAVELVLEDADRLRRTVEEFEARGGAVLRLRAGPAPAAPSVEELGRTVLDAFAYPR